MEELLLIKLIKLHLGEYFILLAESREELHINILRPILINSVLYLLLKLCFQLVVCFLNWTLIVIIWIYGVKRESNKSVHHIKRNTNWISNALNYIEVITIPNPTLIFLGICFLAKIPQCFHWDYSIKWHLY